MVDERQRLPSASPWHAYELCSGRYQLEQEAKRLGQEAHVYSPDADSGERIHRKLNREKIELSETEARTAGFLYERGEEQVERIFEGQEYTQLREKRLWLYLDGKPALSGRFDVVSYTPELALVQDYKTAFREPDPAEDNAQLKVLAVLIALNLPTVKEVVVQIVSGPFGVTEARMGIPELMLAYDDIIKTVKAINAENPPLTPGVEQCKHCGAKLICPALQEKVVVPLFKVQINQLPEGGAGATWILDQVEMMSGFIKEIKAFYSAKFDDPTYAIPGYSMVPGAVQRSVTDWDAARSRLAEYLDVEQLKSAADYRLGDLEKALGKVLKLKAPQAKEKMNQILNGLVAEKQNASSLKRVKGEAKVKELAMP